MLDRQYGEIIVECDGPRCHEILETGTDDFPDARASWRRQGWVSRPVERRIGEAAPVKTEWLHLCPACKDEVDVRQKEMFG